MRLVLAAAFVALGAAPAVADPDITVISIEAGKTLRVPVGQRTEWLCIPDSLMKVSIDERSDQNYWVVKGLQMFETQCRVGSSASPTALLFDITFTKPVAKPTKPKKKSAR